MKKSLILLALPVMLLLSSSFSLPNDHANKPKKETKKTVKRCGPTIIVYSTGVSTNWIQLIYVPDGTTYTVANPTFPYTFPANLYNGDYIINVGISAYPSNGVAYVGITNANSGDDCRQIVNKYVSIPFTANTCNSVPPYSPPVEIRVTPFMCR